MIQRQIPEPFSIHLYQYKQNKGKDDFTIQEEHYYMNHWLTQQYYYYSFPNTSRKLKIYSSYDKPHQKGQKKKQYYVYSSRSKECFTPIVEYPNQKPLAQMVISIISNPLVFSNSEITHKTLESEQCIILKKNIFDSENQQAIIEKKKIDKQKILIRIRAEHNNKRKYWVQVTRMFLRIKSQNVYDIELVKICQVWQNYKNNKFEIAVVKGYIKKQKQNKLLTFLIAYKVNRLQQLIRIENTYQTIFGIITYPKYFPIESYLKQISRKNFAAQNIVINEQKDQKTQIVIDSEIQNDTMTERSMND